MAGTATRRVKIIGAGSIGNHLTQAARRMGWDVVVCDVSREALDRMRDEIYPSRYGSWDDAIEIYETSAAPKGDFDAIFVGTPPDSHLPLAIDAIEEHPRLVVVEKPVCPPSLEGAGELRDTSEQHGVPVLVGYNHVVARSTRMLEDLLRGGAVGPVEWIDVEFREHWGGIFDAHPWLRGPEDSYLGFWRRGGGASGEHSHALNLWQHLAHLAGKGQVVDVGARLRYVNDGNAEYDSICLLDLETEGGLLGRVAQDVVTRPARKRARVQGADGELRWICGYEGRGDAIVVARPGEPESLEVVDKTRPDDFFEEMKVVEEHLNGGDSATAIGLDRGLDTMLVLAAAHRSEQEGCRLRIEYARGYAETALAPCPATRDR